MAARLSSMSLPFKFHPPVPEQPGRFFQQSVELLDGRQPLARVTWQAMPAVEGVCQLMYAEVVEGRRRQGHGSHALAEMVRQAELHGRRAGRPIRRFVAFIAQPNVNARAWLVRNGFVHVHTVNDLSSAPPNGEVLVMVRTFN